MNEVTSGANNFLTIFLQFEHSFVRTAILFDDFSSFLLFFLKVITIDVIYFKVGY